MKTPYDTALRIAERDLDTVRAAIGAAIDELQRIEAQHIAIEAAMLREAMLAAGDPRMTTEHFFVRAREQRALLGNDRLGAQARLEDLRRQAIEAYGTRTAIEGAADSYRTEAERGLVAAEQATVDDLVAARSVASAAAVRTVCAVTAARRGTARHAPELLARPVSRP